MNDEFREPEPLASHHVLTGFDCGEPEINDFRHRNALRDCMAGVYRTWVITDHDHVVQGFVALSAAVQSVKAQYNNRVKHLLRGKVPPTRESRIPVVLIGYLGRRKELLRGGIGTRLLVFGIRQAVETADRIGISGIILDALTEGLLSYYRRAHFQKLPHPNPHNRRMFLTIADARASIGDAQDKSP